MIKNDTSFPKVFSIINTLRNNLISMKALKFSNVKIEIKPKQMLALENTLMDMSL